MRPESGEEEVLRRPVEAKGARSGKREAWPRPPFAGWILLQGVAVIHHERGLERVGEVRGRCVIAPDGKGAARLMPLMPFASLGRVAYNSLGLAGVDRAEAAVRALRAHVQAATGQLGERRQQKKHYEKRDKPFHAGIIALFPP